MRDRKMTLRFNPIETARIAAFADAEGLTRSEAVRRLIFWNRAPDFSLPFEGLTSRLYAEVGARSLADESGLLDDLNEL